MKANLYIQFYNIKDSSNRAEYGPFDSVVCDGERVIVISPGEVADLEEIIAAYDQDRESFMVYRKSCPPFFYGYFEVIARQQEKPRKGAEVR